MGGLMGRFPWPGNRRGADLSGREQEVLRLIVRGFTNREIAAHLDVGTKTVETHKARPMEKLGLDSRAGIVGYAIRWGWLTEG
jgi:DNA-binding NarL/FixJ family response regulator